MPYLCWLALISRCFFFLPFSLTFNFSRKPLTDCYFSAASFRWQQMFWAAPWVFFIIIFFFLVRSVKRNLLILPTCMGCVLLARRLAYPFCPFPRVWRIIKNYLKKALLWAKDLAAPEKKIEEKQNTQQNVRGTRKWKTNTFVSLDGFWKPSSWRQCLNDYMNDWTNDGRCYQQLLAKSQILG